MLYPFPSHLLILSLFCLFHPFPISLLPRWLSFSLRLIPICPPVLFSFAFSFYTSFSSMCLFSSMQLCNIVLLPLGIYSVRSSTGSMVEVLHWMIFTNWWQRELSTVDKCMTYCKILLYYQWCSFRIFTFFQGAWKREKKCHTSSNTCGIPMEQLYC